MKIEHLISKTTYRVTVDKKRYLCCVIEFDDELRVSMSREWGFPVRPRTELWEYIYKEVRKVYDISKC